ncbi:carboxylesterase family protein [Sphingobacterium bovistauri]|uniref:Prolyl oligopeptidase family serine peptidase n=1 Tax=Sphingobacterium bovistauri TaxID=2781959 RepID=A0ABS7Z012_9SPHI|nr:prolyl oligopeptidase family serine peptidase [Sphingobacterium bovistauri]MCA5003525.1 prolyl oligopeptidase family serine peptidase [Sphingobacterium bovistauri]
MNVRILIVLAFLFQLVNLNAETFPIRNKTYYNFLLHMPETVDKTSSLPVIVFLHGKSLSGNNLDRVKRYGVLYAKEKGHQLPNAIIVAPQTNNGWNPDKVIEVIDYVLENYNADPTRIYVCGMSMGAYGTMHVAGKYPNRVAAAVAICGGGNINDACNLTKVPMWIQHGSADRAVPSSESKKIYNAIKKCDQQADTKLTIIKGGTHGSVEKLFHQDAIYDWMMKYTKVQ